MIFNSPSQVFSPFTPEMTKADIETLTPTLPTVTSMPLSTSTPTKTIEPTQTFQPTNTATLTSTPQTFASGPIEIGRSVRGFPIEVYRFGNGPVLRLIIAGIHGGYEWNTVKLAYQLIEIFEQNPSLIPVNNTLYMIPVLNPDGYDRGHGPQGRTNDNGVDLNRNFPTGWLKEPNKSGCWQMAPTTTGPFPISEPESMALDDFLSQKDISALISYHSAGLGVFPGGKPDDLNAVDLAKAISSVSPFFYPPIDTGCQYSGMLSDYAVEQGIAAVDLELSTHWDIELDANLAVLKAFLDWKPRD